MSTITTIAAQTGGTLFGGVTANWDLGSALENGTEYIKYLGAGFLTLMGVIGIIYGGYLLVKKLMAGQQNQDSWVKIVLLIIVGGALSVSGFDLISEIASGGKTTIEELGGGTIIVPLLESLPPLF